MHPDLHYVHISPEGKVGPWGRAPLLARKAKWPPLPPTAE